MKENNGFSYQYEKNIDKAKLVSLFESVGWKTAEYPNRLYHAIQNSDYVMSVWDAARFFGKI